VPHACLGRGRFTCRRRAGQSRKGDSGTTATAGRPGGGSTAVAAGTGSGAATGSGAQPSPAASADRQGAFSFTSNQLAGVEAADGFAALFRVFYIALERQISYLQGTLLLVADCPVVDQIKPLLGDLGVTASILRRPL
jgi:hypothetical protein